MTRQARSAKDDGVRDGVARGGTVGTGPAPGETVPRDAEPGEAGPGEAGPGETVTREAAQGETVTREAAQGETVTREAAQGETAQGETAQGEAAQGETMRSVVYRGVERLELEERPVPAPGPGQIRLRTLRVGICGSDMHAFHGTHPFIRPPIVLGHEVAAVVDVLGASVDGPAPGTLVTVEPNVVGARGGRPDDVNLRLGRYNIAEDLQVIGCVGPDGGMQERFVVPADRVVRVPQGWEPERAALVEPFAVGVHAVRQARLPAGARVAVIGAGTIGLVTALAALAAGAAEVLVTDRVPERLERARALGVQHARDASSEPLSEQLANVFGPDRADAIFDSVTLGATLDAAVNAARKGTPIVILGVPAGKIPLDMALVQDRELELVGTLMYVRRDYDEAIALLDARPELVDAMVTHHVPLELAAEGMRLAISEQRAALKVMIDIGEQDGASQGAA